MTGPRKILVVNKYHFVSGGAERYFLSVMEALRRRNLRAVPFSVNYPRTLPTPYQKYFLEPVVRGPEAKIQKQRPGPVQRIRLAARAVYSTAAHAAVRRLIRAEKPDAAYLLNINNHLSPSIIDACHAESVPVVMRLSDFNFVCSSNMYYRNGHPCMDCKKGLHHAVIHRCVHGSLTKSAVSVLALSVHRWLGVYRRVAAFVAPTAFMKKELVEFGVPEERVHHIRTFARPEAETRPDLESPYFLYAGRFAAYKGADLALEAFARVSSRNHVAFYLAEDEGDADARRLRNRAGALGLRNVRFVPFERDREKLTALVQKSLFTIVPSQFYENLPNAILESFACGRPVIATRLGSIPEIVRDGHNGLLFEWGDAADLGRKIEDLIRDPEKRDKMSRSARATISSDYDEDGHMNGLLKLFERIWK